MVEEIKRLCREEAFILTLHAVDRLLERGISQEEVLNAILCGEAIESYPDDYPFPSVLLHGDGLHVVCALGELQGEPIAVIVTAYRPSLDRWEPDMRTSLQIKSQAQISRLPKKSRKPSN